MTAGKLALCTVSGAAVGLATGLVTKGLQYHAKSGEVVYVILLDDASVPATKAAL